MSTTLSSKNGILARKSHYCCLCGETINKGDRQDTRTGVNIDGVRTMHMHPECHAFERVVGSVDREWYEDISEPAFKRPVA